MFVLIIVLLTSTGHVATTSSTLFNSESRCLEALSKIVQMERGFRVSGMCTKQ